MTSPLLAALAALVPLLAQAAPPPQPRAPGRAAPRQTEVLRLQDPPRQRPLLARAADALAGAARRLWRREEPHAAAGNAKAAGGDVEGALQEYEAAEKRVPPGGDAAAALAFDRSGALLKGPPEAAPRALELALRAQESSDHSLHAKAAYNAALALEAAGKPEEAIKAYGQALALDPDDVDSKVNLELLLRTEEQKKQQAAGPQDPDAKKKPQQGKDQQKSKDEQKQDQQKQKPGEQEQKKEEQQAQPRPEEQQKEEQKPQAAKQEPAVPEQPKEEPIGRSEAQRLLDAARAGERNLQTWRFGKRADLHKRQPAEKDW